MISAGHLLAALHGPHTILGWSLSSVYVTWLRLAVHVPQRLRVAVCVPVCGACVATWLEPRSREIWMVGLMWGFVWYFSCVHKDGTCGQG